MHHYFGLFAGLDRWLSGIRINGVRLNVWMMVFLPIICFFAYFVAQGDQSPVTWTVFAVSSLLLFSLGIPFLRHDIIFGPDLIPHSDAKPNNLDGLACKADSAMETAVHATGRFVLWEGDRTRWQVLLDRLMTGKRGSTWLVEAPAKLVAEVGKQFMITAELDLSPLYFGHRVGNKSGIWSIDGNFDSLDRLRLGTLYLGLRRRPAVKAQFQNVLGQRRWVVLTFDDANERHQFLQRMRCAARENWPGCY